MAVVGTKIIGARGERIVYVDADPTSTSVNAPKGSVIILLGSPNQVWIKDDDGDTTNVTLVAVRVLNCQGSGTYSQVIAGIDWVTADHDPGELAVANMSLGGGASASLNQAVANSVNDGVTYAVSAGNSNGDACSQSPAGEPTALTVGSTTSSDSRSSFSNFGMCVDVFAPGSSITSAYNTSNTGTAVLSGTSMSSPHVAGVAACCGHDFPCFT